MRKALIIALQISVIFGDVPLYAAVGSSHCLIEFYHFATSYYARDKNSAKNRCKDYDCDIIIKWTRTSKTGKDMTGWDVGNFDGPVCPQNTAMTAEVIWQKDSEFSNANNTAIGRINIVDKYWKYVVRATNLFRIMVILV